MQLSHRGKWLASIVVVCVMLALLLALAEGAVRLRQWLEYGSTEVISSLYRYDPQLDLRVPVAGMQTATVSINAQGFRGPEIAAEKPAGRVRLAFLGASTTFSAEVSSNAMTWPALLVDKLRRRYPEVSFDYLNAAVPGYTVDGSIRSLERRVKPYRPDVIVIYHATNDLSGDVRRLAQQQGIKTPNPDETSWPGRYSLLWYLVEKNLRLRSIQAAAAQNKDRLQVQPEQLGDDFRARLSALIEAARQVAEVVAVATFSYQIRAEQSAEQQLEAAASALYYMPFMTPDGLLTGYQRYNQIIRETAAAADVLLIDGELDIPGDSVHFNDTVHFTDAGSRVMAGRVYDGLLASPALQRLIDRAADGG